MNKNLYNLFRQNFWGPVVIVFGLLLLFQNLGYISFEIWDYFFPALLILFGLNIIFRPKSSFWCCCVPYYRETEKTG